jgi:hypothetical protein
MALSRAEDLPGGGRPRAPGGSGVARRRPFSASRGAALDPRLPIGRGGPNADAGGFSEPLLKGHARKAASACSEICAGPSLGSAASEVLESSVVRRVALSLLGEAGPGEQALRFGAAAEGVQAPPELIPRPGDLT